MFDFLPNRHQYRQGTSGSMTLPTEQYRLTTGTKLEGDMAWTHVFSDRWGETYRIGNWARRWYCPKIYAT